MLKIRPRLRLNYWSCSKFANFIRGENKPYALALEEWEQWRKNQQQKRPWRYWLSDIVLNKLQKLFFLPGDIFYTIRVYIRNRYIDKIHYLKTGLTPGEFYDLDDRILHGLFNELTIFYEYNSKYYSLDKKIVELYHWWNVDRKNRPDPLELFSREKHGPQYHIMMAELCDQYEKEDTKMLIRLIKLRKILWT